MSQYKSLFHHIYIDYLLVYLLLASSGMMFFYRNEEYIVIGFVLSALLFLLRKRQFDVFFGLVIGIFICLEVLILTWFPKGEITTMLGTIIRVGFAYFTVRSVGEKFVKIFINIMVFLALVSFLFYGLTFFTPITKFIVSKIAVYFQPIFELNDRRYGYTPNIILYNYNPDHVAWFRNSGPFWESGAFAVYLNIALLFSSVVEKNIFTRKNLILIIALFTTISTGGLLSLFFFLFAYFMLRKDVKYKYIYILIVGVVAVYGFFNLSFMEEKISQNIRVSGYNTHSRIGSAVTDLKVLSMTPYFGTGRSQANRSALSLSVGSAEHRNNGVTGYLSEYGVFMFLFTFGAFWYSFKKYVNHYYQFPKTNSLAWVMLITLMIIGFSQRIFMFPFAFSLMFVHLIKFNNLKERD
jgi:hypothetical protein